MGLDPDATADRTVAGVDAVDDRPTWSIGELAAAASVSVRTIRHYEAEGLLMPAARTRAGYRRFDADAAGRLYRVVALRSLGLGVAEVRDLLAAPDPDAALRATAARHIEALDRQVVAAHDLRDRLAALVATDDPSPTDLLEATAMTVNLDRITTRTGDDGSTSVAGRRVRKDHARVEALGAVDDLNAQVGGAACHPDAPADHVSVLVEVQQRLFDLGADLASRRDGPGRVRAEDVTGLEQQVADLTAGQAPLTSFILPGGGPYPALLHVCRTACRTAERRVVTVADGDGTAVPPAALHYLNRLSDLFFVLARDASTTEVLWEPRPADDRQPVV